MNPRHPPVVVSDDEQNFEMPQPFGPGTPLGGLSSAVISQPEDSYLDALVHQIKRKPARLMAHIYRIYWCYRNQLSEPLFAALVDFLIVLNRRGQAVSRKMVSGASARLSSEQLAILNSYWTDPESDISLLPGNRYSIFSKGLEGRTRLIEKTVDTNCLDHDPLHLAEDAIAYCQLNEAIVILENALREQPRRLSLHQALLELYRYTNERSRFESMSAELAAIGETLPDIWDKLADHFKGHAE